MLRGLVYSIIAICIFLCGSIIFIISSGMEEADSSLTGGWLLLIAIFAVGPVSFALGYWHNRKLYPDEPHWDAETGE